MSISAKVSLQSMFAGCWHNRKLIVALAKREIIGRYKGSVFGMVWSFFNPIFMLCVYTFIFSFVFNARWGESQGSTAEFSLILFAGLIIFNFFSEVILRSPNLIISNSNYVKKIVFPLEIFPIVCVVAALFHTLISIIVWLIFYVLWLGVPHLAILLFPFVLMPLILFTLGVSWLLSSLGAYLRDIGQMIGILMTALMFLSPIFYPISAIPEKYRGLLALNPLAPAISQLRDLFYWGKVSSLGEYIPYFLGCLLFAWFGFYVFQKIKRGFADVL